MGKYLITTELWRRIGGCLPPFRDPPNLRYIEAIQSDGQVGLRPVESLAGLVPEIYCPLESQQEHGAENICGDSGPGRCFSGQQLPKPQKNSFSAARPVQEATRYHAPCL